MGYYIPANDIRTGYASRESIHLNAAVTRFKRWDIFVCHKSNDAAKAARIAERISMNGLSVWVDVADPTDLRDGPELADYIRSVLSASRSLLAVVTSATKESWWVPFEIGIAFEQEKLLASYGSRLNLPSFLYKWPNIQSDEQLDRWCSELRSPAPSTSGAYATRMRTLAANF